MLYFLLFASIFIVLIIRFSWFIPATKGLPILMYHKVSLTETDSLTVTIKQLEQQFLFIKSLDYQCITTNQLTDFMYNKKPLPKNPILLTFDDGYKNNLDLAYPLLKKHQLKATIFLPTAYVGKSSNWDTNAAPIMSVEELKTMDNNTIEFALHSHTHCNFKQESLDKMKQELLENIQFLKDNKLRFSSVFAYPYGGRPKDKNLLQEMKNMMMENGIKIAFRIGNRVNKLPLKDNYEVQRIDIQGTDSFWEFKTKLKKGRVKQL